MSFNVNNTVVNAATFNGQEVTSIYCNNSLVWLKPGNFPWGAEDEIGDAAWWSSLRTWVQTAEPEELAACVGKVKRVGFPNDLYGWNGYKAVPMRCIGANHDGEHTLTFQAAGGIFDIVYGVEGPGQCPKCGEPFENPNNYTGWAYHHITCNGINGNGYAWINTERSGNTYESNVRTQCRLFYNKCSAHDAIKPVLKGTMCHVEDRNYEPTWNALTNKEPDWGSFEAGYEPEPNWDIFEGNEFVHYELEPVFLLSPIEYGFGKIISIGDKYWTSTNSENTYGVARDKHYDWWYSTQPDKLGKISYSGKITPPADGEYYYYWTRSINYYPLLTGVPGASTDSSLGDFDFGGGAFAIRNGSQIVTRKIEDQKAMLQPAFVIG